ncbi:MAG: tRNA ((6)-L-threonylcarbamoyladenosine(37)-C(2))-methylthiotransferase MtaB [Bacteroidota bacterium]|jgi:threonylcarbamoyladenosine tRNA methylthiotransferase MtaB
MEQQGYAKHAFDSDDAADVYVINTCSVTENADKECKQIVRRIQRKAPEAVVVITGCYAQLKPEEIATIPGVDLVLGAAEKFNLPKHIAAFTKGDATKICSCDIGDVHEFTSSYSEGDRTRTFLKVQDGCNYNCSFCTIPMARGESRSDSVDNVLQNIAAIASGNCKEIVLTGINLGDYYYTNTNDTKYNFYNLVQAIEAANTGQMRFRISSIEPNLLSDDIIELVAASKKFMPHFHIPLQSGSNSILGLMRRRYRRELYAQRVAYIKRMMPHCCIGVDVIVGFPGETDAHFQETFDFLHSLDISYLHVFTYSERTNTLAETMANPVPMNTRHERNKILRNLSYQKMQYFTQQHMGQSREVLWEKNAKGNAMEGYTDNYIRLETMYNAQKAGTVETYLIS